MGPLFTRERIGRLSILRDALWWAPASVAPASAIAAPAVDEAFACYGTWAFGCTPPDSEQVVRLVCDWHGRGLVRWRSCGRDGVASFTLDPELVGRFFYSMEAMRPVDRGDMRRVTSFLDTVLAPLLLHAGVSDKPTRLQLGGVIGELPVLMTMVDGVALGASADVGYLHPNPEVTGRAANTEPFDLLVIDDCFGSEAMRVGRALQDGAGDGRAYVTLAFNSDAGADEALGHDQLASALQSARRALIFCHCESVAGMAGAASIVTGKNSRFGVDTLAGLELRALDELVVIGCSTGRADPFVGDISVAHAAAVAGARQLLYSLWPLRPRRAADFVVALLEARSSGMPTVDCLAEQYRADRVRAGGFVIMRP